MRYTLTTQDRAKGGKTTAARHNMSERGKQGLQRFADNHFDGDTKLAGKALSAIGNFVTDPARWNGAWALPAYIPEPLKQSLVARYSRSDDAIPF